MEADSVELELSYGEAWKREIYREKTNFVLDRMAKIIENRSGKTWEIFNPFIKQNPFFGKERSTKGHGISDWH